MWFRNPFLRLYSGVDIQIACDHYYGNPADLANSPNGGFLYVRSNQRTVEYYKYWYESRLAHPGKHDQDVFNEIKGDQRYLEIGVEIQFLDTLYFAGFCEVSRDLGKVCTMHANCCIGLQNKLADLRLVLEDWNTYRNLTAAQKKTERVSWRAPRQC